MGRLDGRVAMITGSGQGIGKAIALCFAREGADIIVNDVAVPNMETTATEIKALGRKVIAIKADVSKKDDVNKLVTTAIDTFKKVDILVNNAAITRHAPLLEMTEEDWDVVLDVDLKGVFLCTQAVARHMVQQKYGKIINMSSLAGVGSGEPFMANYGSAKAAVAELTKITAKALGQYGINVNSIAPGLILTEQPLTRRTPAEFEALVERRKGLSALGRIGTVEDVASLALFLASDESSFITGQVIVCDGGRRDKM